MSRHRTQRTRRQFLGAVGAGASAVLLRRRAGERGEPSRAGRPNVLFIAVDDINDWVGALGGHPQARTPHFDALAARGVLFTNAHCAAPLCGPSRAAVLTGVRPSTSGVYTNDHSWRAAMPEAVTLPRLFRDGGYASLGSGKIFHGDFPDEDSWDEYHVPAQKAAPGAPHPDPLPADRPVSGIPGAGWFDWGPVDVADEEMSDYRTVSWVADVLARDHSQPFFLGCGIYRPHLPWYVPRRYFELYPLEGIQLPRIREDDLADLPDIARAYAGSPPDHGRILRRDQWRHAVRGYLASLSFSDAMLGRVIDAYDASGRGEDTIVVLWTDHGWHLGEKLHWRKWTLWEEATRVPLVILAPGVTEPGRCERAVNLLDIYPTLADLSGLSPPEEIEGVSLRPLLVDPSAKWSRPSITTCGRGNHAVRTQRWRYIRYAGGAEELYDHEADPEEWVNLAGVPEHAQVKRRLARHLPKRNAPDAPVGR